MTTAAAQSSIVECLQANAYFGLVPNQVHVFAPDLSVPLLTEDGKMAMETPFRVARTQGSSGERGCVGLGQVVMGWHTCKTAAVS